MAPLGNSMGGDDILGTFSHGLSTNAQNRALANKKKENDPGFWGTVGKQSVASSVILHRVERFANKRLRNRYYGEYAEEGYDWREVAEKYPQVPREVLEGSRSTVETDGRLWEYEQDIYARAAMEDHPWASFFGRCFGFGADLWAIKRIPFIGGLTIAAETRAGRLVSNSILKGAVRNGVSFALEMGEIGALRALVDDRVTFGNGMMDIPKEMMVGAFIGGALGAGGAKLKKSRLERMWKKNPFTRPLEVRMGEQVEEGTHLPTSPALGNDSYGSLEEYEAARERQAMAMADMMAAHDLPPLGDDTSKNFVTVVGGIGVKSATEKPSAIALSRLATDKLTRAFASPSLTVSGLARLLHDNHLLFLGDGELPLDVAVRTATNGHRGTVAKIVEDIFRKISQDRSLPPLSREEIRRLFGQVHLNNGVIPDGLSPQLASIIGDGYSRIKSSFFDAMEEMFLDIQRMKYGPELVAQSKKRVAQLENQAANARKEYEGFVGSKDARVAKEVAREVAREEKNGLAKSEEAVLKSREKKVSAIKKNFENLRRKVVRGGGDHGTAMTSIMEVMESMGPRSKQPLGGMLRAVEKGKATMEDAIAALDAMEESIIGEVDRAVDHQLGALKQSTKWGKGNRRGASAMAKMDMAEGKKLARENLQRARKEKIASIRKKFRDLKDKLTDGSGDYGAAMESVMEVVEGMGGARQAANNMVKAVERGKAAVGDAIKSLDAMEERSILEVNGSAERQLAARRKVWEDAKAAAEKSHDVAANRMKRDMEGVEKQLADEKSLLDDQASGKFSRDRQEFLQKEDAHYIRRIYDIAKVMKFPKAFIGDITKNLMAYTDITAKEADAIAHNLYNELMNGYGRGGKVARAVTERGVEKSRAFNFPTEVVRDWLVDDIQEIADSIADTLVPDHALMKHLGTYEASPFLERVAKDVDDLVASGKLKVGDRKPFLDDAMDTIQSLIDNVRYLGKMPPGSIKSSTVAWQASSIARSLTTAVAMGGAPLLSIFDAASTILNKGFFSALRDDFIPFLKFVFSRSFRDAVRNHPDMVSLSGWLGVMTRKSTVSRMMDYGIPVGTMSRATEGARAIAEFQFKWTGAKALFNAMHMVADYGSLLTLSRISEKAAKGLVLSPTERNILALARISEKDAVKIGEMVAKHGTEVNGVRHLNFHAWEDGKLAFAMEYGSNNVTMNSILLPGSEVPKALRTPLGEVLFQYKKFYFAAIDRCFLPAINRLAEGEWNILSNAFIMVTMGGLKEVLSRLAAGREPPSFHDFWMYGVGNSDVLPFVGGVVRDVGLGFHSKGVVGDTSLTRIIDDFFVPPAAGLLKRVPFAIHGTYNLLSGQPLTQQQIHALKRSLPFNNTIYFNILINQLNAPRNGKNYHDIY
jgi:hypothetical protein